METQTLTKEHKTLFNDLIKPWDEWLDNGFWFRTVHTPSVNIVEEKDHFIVTLAAPGLKKEDFKISINGNNKLSISCEKEEREEKTDVNYTRKEYSYTSFNRSLTLPEEVKHEGIEAKYVDGILSIHLPRTVEAKSQTEKTILVK